jgi:site-specific recombinase XerD
MKINHNIKADTRGKGPMVQLFIDMSWTVDGKQSRNSISLGKNFRVLREDWDKKRMMIIPSSPYSIPVRNRMIALMDFMMTLNCDSPDDFRAHVRSCTEISPKEKPGPQSLHEFVEMFISQNTGKYSENTIRRYRTLIVNLEKFRGDSFRSMARDQQGSWFSDYVSYLLDKGYSNSSVKQEFKLISSVRNAFTDIGITVDTSRYISHLKTGNSESVFLDDDELMEFMAGDDGELAVVSMFILMCLTGLRVSELYSLNKESVLTSGPPGNISILNYLSVKTGNMNSVPMCAAAMRAFDRLMYNDMLMLPEGVARTSLRMYLKSIPIFQRECTKLVYSGNKITETKVNRYDMITLHSARHTYSRIMTSGGMSIDDVGKLLSHGSSETTRKHYQHVSDSARMVSALAILDKKTRDQILDL